MAIAFRAANTQHATGQVSTITITKPTGTASGDVLITVIAGYKSTAASINSVINTLSGWTRLTGLDSSNNTTQDVGHAVFWKIAGGSEPTSYTFTSSASVIEGGAVAAFSGANNSTPIVTFANAPSTSTSAPTAPPVSAVAGHMLVCLFSLDNNASLPGGLTSVYSDQNPSDMSIYGGYAAISSGGSTGAFSLTATASDWITTSLLIQTTGVRIIPTSAALSDSRYTGGHYFRGANIFGGWQGGFGGTDTFPTSTQMNYYHSKGIDWFRVPLRWEAVQPTLSAALDSTYLGKMDALVTAAAANGQHIAFTLINQGQYPIGGTNLGATGVAYTDFADFWSRMATHYASSATVFAYDLMNEPYHTVSWSSASAAAITAIRAVDAVKPIITTPGPDHQPYRYTGFTPYTGTNLWYEAHVYGDVPGDPSGYGTYSPNNYDSNSAGMNGFADRLNPFVAWLKANNQIGVVGEIGVPGVWTGGDNTGITGGGTVDSRWATMLDNGLTYADEYGLHVWYWNVGDYGDINSMEPVSGVEQANMVTFTSHASTIAVTRSMPSTAALYTTATRTASASTALMATSKRNITGSASFSLTARIMTASASFSLATTPIYYLGSVLDSTLLLTASDISTTTGGTATGKDTPLGALTGYGELAPNSAPATWPAQTSEAACLPSGKGNIFDSTALQSIGLLAGNWTPTIRVTLAGTSPVAITADLIMRFWKWNSSTLAYTRFGASTLTAQSVSTTATTLVLPAVTLQLIALAANEYLYIDLVANVTANSNAAGVGAKIRINFSNSATTGVNTAQVVAPSAVSFRLMPASFAALATATRSLPATASITLVNTHTIGTNTAAMLATATRSAGATFAALATNTRTIIGNSSAMLVTASRNVPTSAAFQASTTRMISASFAALATSSRNITATFAALATKTRSAGASAALQGGDIRPMPATFAALATATRSAISSVALSGTFTRSVSCTLSACRGPLALPYVMQRPDSNYLTASGRNLVYKGSNVKLYGCTIYLSTQGGSPAWQTDITTTLDDLFFRAWLNGLNMIRITDFWDSSHATQQMDDPQVWRNIDYCVTKAQQYGMFVMMDISGYKALLTSHGVDPTVASNWTDFVSYVGYHYGGSAPQICWYNLSGEPATPTDQTTTDALLAFYTSLVNTMYAADSSHLISSGGLTHTNTIVTPLTYPAWWQPIFALAHNSICSVKNYSVNDLQYMSTIATQVQALNKPLSINEFGAEQEQGDLIFPQFTSTLATPIVSGTPTTSIGINTTIASTILAGTILSINGVQNCVVSTTVSTGTAISVNSFIPSANYGSGTTVTALGFADITHGLADTADNYYAAVFGTSVTINAWKVSNQTVVATATPGGDQSGVTSYVVWNLGDQQNPSGYDVSNTVMPGAWGVVKNKALSDGMTPAPFTIRQIPTAAYFSRLRQTPASVALLTTNTRSMPTSAALIATVQRSAPASAALQGTMIRVMLASFAAMSTLTRSAGASVAFIATSTQSAPASVALITTATRSASASAALLSTTKRIAPGNVALIATATRIAPTSAALIVTRLRVLTASASLSQAPRPIQCTVSDAAIVTITILDSLGAVA